MSTASRTFSLSSYLHRHKIASTFSRSIVPAIVHQEKEQLEKDLMLLAKKILEDPLLKQEICERIFVLIQENIEQEKERCQPSWRRI